MKAQSFPASSPKKQPLFGSGTVGQNVWLARKLVFGHERQRGTHETYETAFRGCFVGVSLKGMCCFRCVSMCRLVLCCLVPCASIQNRCHTNKRRHDIHDRHNTPIAQFSPRDTERKIERGSKRLTPHLLAGYVSRIWNMEKEVFKMNFELNRMFIVLVPLKLWNSNDAVSTVRLYTLFIIKIVV